MFAESCCQPEVNLSECCLEFVKGEHAMLAVIAGASCTAQPDLLVSQSVLAESCHAYDSAGCNKL
jgi:hypothetical protein